VKIDYGTEARALNGLEEPLKNYISAFATNFMDTYKSKRHVVDQGAPESSAGRCFYL
jgi:hypothetical protein